MTQPTGNKVLLVEDEPQMQRFLRTSLTAHGHVFLSATTLAEALRVLSTQNPEIILLDLGLPDGNGIDFIREVRSWTQLPIVVISARGQESDKVAALDAGADDYLTKPFGINELLARIRLALRHYRPETADASDGILMIGGLKIDTKKREVTVDAKAVYFTPTEYNLVHLLARHAGLVLTHRQILKEVWGAAYANQTHYLRVFMNHVRRKIESDPSQPKRIVTEQGIGYRLRADEL